MNGGDLGNIRKVLAHDLTQVYIRLLLVMVVVWFSVETFAPFLPLMLWSLILAVSLNPVNQWLAERLRLGTGVTATLFVLIVLLIIGTPTILLGVSMAEHVRDWVAYFGEYGGAIPEADPAVAEWPVIGPTAFKLWQTAYQDLAAIAQMAQPQLLSVGKFLLGAAANTLLALVLFFLALIIAGFMMASATKGSVQSQRLLSTFSSEQRGAELQQLVVATIRSVSNGVVGVAFMQALALGVGFLVLDVPAAGVLAVVALFLGVLQLPLALVVLPSIAWLWLGEGTSGITAGLGSAYLLAAGFADGILKPYLLGRGVDTPMPIVLIGALGGMASEGLIGLFVGAVMLSVGYKLLSSWVDRSLAENEALESGSP